MSNELNECMNRELTERQTHQLILQHRSAAIVVAPQAHLATLSMIVDTRAALAAA